MPGADAPTPSRPDGRRGWLRIGLVAASVVAVAAVGWQIVASAQARMLAEAAPEEALLWRADYAKALSLLAERDFIDAAAGGRSVEQAREEARRALKVNPLDVRAMRVLGWVAEEAGDDRRALRLMTLAASRSQRDVSSHLWMFHNRLRARDFNAAFAHGDALMRHAATMRETAVLMASAAGADEAATTALTRRLQTGPSWRNAFVRELAASQDPDITLRVLLAVKEAGATIHPEESSALATRLLRVGRPREAYLAWVLLLSPAGYDVLDNVYDGGFEGPAAAGPFAWTLPRRGVEIGQAPGRQGKALLAEFSGGKEQVMARQTLVLTPGLYRLRVDAKMDGVGGGQMEWALSCAGAPAGSLARLPVPDSNDWTPLTVTFAVAPGCEAQRLELRARGKGDVSAWGRFDDVRVELVGA